MRYLGNLFWRGPRGDGGSQDWSTIVRGYVWLLQQKMKVTGQKYGSGMFSLPNGQRVSVMIPLGGAPVVTVSPAIPSNSYMLTEYEYYFTNEYSVLNPLHLEFTSVWDDEWIWESGSPWKTKSVDSNVWSAGNYFVSGSFAGGTVVTYSDVPKRVPLDVAFFEAVSDRYGYLSLNAPPQVIGGDVCALLYSDSKLKSIYKGAILQSTYLDLAQAKLVYSDSAVAGNISEIEITNNDLRIDATVAPCISSQYIVANGANTGAVRAYFQPGASTEGWIFYSIDATYTDFSDCFMYYPGYYPFHSRPTTEDNAPITCTLEYSKVNLVPSKPVLVGRMGWKVRHPGLESEQPWLEFIVVVIALHINNEFVGIKVRFDCPQPSDTPNDATCFTTLTISDPNNAGRLPRATFNGGKAVFIIDGIQPITDANDFSIDAPVQTADIETAYLSVNEDADPPWVPQTYRNPYVAPAEGYWPNPNLFNIVGHLETL